MRIRDREDRGKSDIVNAEIGAAYTAMKEGGGEMAAERYGTVAYRSHERILDSVNGSLYIQNAKKIGTKIRGCSSGGEERPLSRRGDGTDDIEVSVKLAFECCRFNRDNANGER